MCKFDPQGGARRHKRTLQKELDGTLPLTNDVASEAAQINLALKQEGTSLDIVDLLDVATARDAGATFVTRDLDDFDNSSTRRLLTIDLLQS